MAFTPINDLVAMVINELSQVPGVVTQKYSSPVILQYLQNAYLLEIEEVWWPDYMNYFFGIDIDPTTGLLTSDLTVGGRSTDDFGDVQYVWGPQGGRPLSQLPDNRDPSFLTGASGASPLYIAPDFTIPHRPLRVFPPSSTGPITVRSRARTPTPFTNATTVGIDPLLLVFDAAWQYCITDGTLPSQVAKYELLIRKRRQQMITNFNNQSVPLDARFPFDSLIQEGETQNGPASFILDTPQATI